MQNRGDEELVVPFRSSKAGSYDIAPFAAFGFVNASTVKVCCCKTYGLWARLFYYYYFF